MEEREREEKGGTRLEKGSYKNSEWEGECDFGIREIDSYTTQNIDRAPSTLSKFTYGLRLCSTC